MLPSSAQQPDYGIDGPRDVALLLLASAGSMGVAAWLQQLQVSPSWDILLVQVALLVLATDCLLLAGSLLWYSKVEKQRSAMAVGSGSLARRRASSGCGDRPLFAAAERADQVSRA